VVDNDEVQNLSRVRLGAPRGAEKYFSVLLGGKMDSGVLLVEGTLVARGAAVSLVLDVSGTSIGVPMDLEWRNGV
jgi:hypothetical protein